MIDTVKFLLVLASGFIFAGSVMRWLLIKAIGDVREGRNL